MDEKSFKKLLDEALVPIKKDLTKVKQAQGVMKQSQDGMKQAQDGMKQAQDGMKQAQDGMKQAQDGMKQAQDGMKQAQQKIQDTLDNRVIPSITETEMTVKSYADSYKENQRNIKRLDTRLNVVEEELAIELPEDLKIPHFVS